MDVTEFRRSLTTLIGTEQYVRVLRFFNGEGRWRCRFLFWQEKMLRPFANHPVVGPVSFERFEELLRICERHQVELERDPEAVSCRCHGAVTEYTRAKAERFPNTDCGPLDMGGRRDYYRTGLWYCPACRIVEAEWRGRHDGTGEG